MSRRRVLVLVAILLIGRPEDAAAVDIGTPGEPLSVEIHGFVSPGFLMTTENNYLTRSRRGSFKFSEVGLNFTVPLTDKLRTGIQLFSRDLGPLGNYTPKVDFYYLDYRFEDWLGLRAGRVKIPFGLYNDTSDIDTARVPVLLPQSVYPINNRDFLLAQTGVEIYGRLKLGAAGALTHNTYGGTIYLDATEFSGSAAQVTNIDIPYVAGERVTWETPIEGLRAGGSFQAIRIDIDYSFQNRPLTLKVPAILTIGSIEYAADKLLLSAEYSRWYVRSKVEPAIVPDNSSVSERAYGMASYRLSSWLQPGVYYSVLFPNIHERSGPAGAQHDVAATLRFDINDYWLIKVEGHFMSGTAALTPALNDNKPLNTLERQWGLFLVKTTVHF